MSCVPANASPTPATPPSRASTVLCVSACRICVDRGAPSAARMEVCCLRVVARTSSQIGYVGACDHQNESPEIHMSRCSPRLIFVAHHLNTSAARRKMQGLLRHEPLVPRVGAWLTGLSSHCCNSTCMMGFHAHHIRARCDAPDQVEPVLLRESPGCCSMR